MKLKKIFEKIKGFHVITFVYLLTFLLMLPLKNQGFEDDFAYIQTTNNLFKTGVLRISDWASATMVFPPVWGVIFFKLFGQSITVLHLSNIVLFYFGLICFYKLLKKIDIEEGRATIFTLILMSIPWVFHFVYSFMSDTFYVSLLIISLFYYIKAFQEKNYFSAFLGSAFAGLAFLTRQIAIVIPISLILVFIFNFIKYKKIEIPLILSSLLPVFITLILYYSWLDNVGLSAFQYLTIGPKFKKDFLLIIFPFKIGQIGGVNSFYIEFLSQRLTAYINVILSVLFPLIFLYKIKIKEIFAFVKENFKHILVAVGLTTFIYLVNFFYKQKFTSVPPSGIIYRQSTLFDWYIVWPYIFWFALPFLLGLVVLIFKRTFNHIFTKKHSINLTFFRNFVLFFLLIFFLMFLNMTMKTYPSYFSINSFEQNLNPLVFKISAFLEIYKTKEMVIELFKGSWFFYLTIYSFLIFMVYLLTHYKLKKIDKSSSKLLFLGLAFIGHFVLVLIFAYFYWEEYIIQLSPFIVIGIAYSTKKFELQKLGVIAVTIYMIFFSIMTTRHRYQRVGATWETATILVNEYQVSPLNVTEAGWGWRPWWYFESTFAEQVKKAGGNKYAVSRIGGEWNEMRDDGPAYNINETSVGSNDDSSAFLKSEPYWVFWGWKRMVAKRVN